MLTPWALRHKGWKKRLAWWLYQKRDLQRAQVLHATSDTELAVFRDAGLSQPVAVVPNGVDLPPECESRCVRTSGQQRTVLFLGRIHPVKGLLDWVEAWARMRPAGWRAVVAGPDEGGHRAEVEAAVRGHGLERDFKFIGPVSPAERWAMYRSADVFVLPSRSENFGNVVAEALACGVPVITTRATPWPELESHRCGWWVEANAPALAEALRKATACNDAERIEMGARGRELVRARYTWPAVAERMLAVYRWMLGECPRPEWVRVGESARRD
jgi:glycosyltransferase involved in cell wall biosynthesis